MIKKISLAFVVLLVLGTSGCALWKDVKEWWRPSDMARATPEGLYNRGVEQYQDGRYRKAVQSFQRLREQFPLHRLAPDAEIGIADSYFSDESYVEAELTYKDFIDLRPSNDNIPYAMYQLGMCHYKQMSTIDRDQTDTVKALKAFERLIARFPGSKFSLLAERHVLECRKKLAESEFYVGHFYFLRGKYKAALGRFETIAKNYRGIGLDYKVDYFIAESKKKLNQQEAEEKAKREKEEKKARASKEKAASTVAPEAIKAAATPDETAAAKTTPAPAPAAGTSPAAETASAESRR